MKLNGDYLQDMAILHLGRIFAAVFFVLSYRKRHKRTHKKKNIHFVYYSNTISINFNFSHKKFAHFKNLH